MPTIQDFSALKDLMNDKFVDDAIELVKRGQYVQAADKIDELDLSQEQKQSHAYSLAYTYYRRALLNQRDGKVRKSINDLEVARSFPGVPEPLRLLVQARQTAIQSSGRSSEIQAFDEAVTRRFGDHSAKIDLRKEFLGKYGLSQAQRYLSIPGVDAISCIGVYRWTADPHHGEKWSQIIRKFKKGEEVTPIFFGRILTEHIRSTPQCTEWLEEIDYIIPVPSSSRRMAERRSDIVGQVAGNLGQRLAVPVRTDVLRRLDNSTRSRFLNRAGLASQYSFNSRKTRYIEARAVLRCCHGNWLVSAAGGE